MLEAQTHPAVGFIVTTETPRRDGVGKNKKTAVSSRRSSKPLEQQTALVLEHRLKPLAAHIAATRAVNRIAESHVVSGHRFGDRPRRAADREEMPRDFLPSSDFSKGSVESLAEIDLQRLARRAELTSQIFHRFQSRTRNVSLFSKLRMKATASRAALRASSSETISTGECM